MSRDCRWLQVARWRPADFSGRRKGVTPPDRADARLHRVRARPPARNACGRHAWRRTGPLPMARETAPPERRISLCCQPLLPLPPKRLQSRLVRPNAACGSPRDRACQSTSHPSYVFFRDLLLKPVFWSGHKCGMAWSWRAIRYGTMVTSSHFAAGGTTALALGRGDRARPAGRREGAECPPQRGLRICPGHAEIGGAEIGGKRG